MDEFTVLLPADTPSPSSIPGLSMSPTYDAAPSPTSMPTFARLQPLVLNLLRIMTGFLFFQHGAAKLYGWFDGTVQPFPELTFFAGGIEFFGGLLVMVGLFTRPVAFLCSGLMAFAYFMGHADRGFWPYVNGGSLAALYCFVFFYLVFAGGGKLSVDGILDRRRRRALKAAQAEPKRPVSPPAPTPTNSERTPSPVSDPATGSGSQERVRGSTSDS